MTRSSFTSISAVLAVVLTFVGCGALPAFGQHPSGSAVRVDATSTALSSAILEGARKEAVKGTPYIMNYEVIKYPGGDVKEGTGVCTDLVVRAFRNAGIDLQKEVHRDRLARPSAYPDVWDKNVVDSNIDHRRCPNLVAWFRKHAETLTTDLGSDSFGQWRAGDVVFFVKDEASHPWHVAIVADRRDPESGMPMIIDSFPPRTSESHRLDDFAPIHRHFRMVKSGTR